MPYVCGNESNAPQLTRISLGRNHELVEALLPSRFALRYRVHGDSAARSGRARCQVLG